MTHFVDRVPFQWNAPGALELRDLLASVYNRSSQVEQMAKRAGVVTGYVNWDRPMMTVWFDLIETASNQKQLRPLLEAVTSGPDRAVGDRVRELLDTHPVVEAPDRTNRAGDFAHFEDVDDLERQIFRSSTLQDVVFLRRGTELATAVCRLRVTAADGAQYHGTAFRIADDLLLTNHHVLFDAAGEQPTAVEAWFGYEADLHGRTRDHQVVVCEPASAVGESEPDWAAIRSTADMPDDAMRVPFPGSVSVARNDRVYIIQHPHGGVKKLGARHNVVRHVDDTVIQYWTDTEQGSSGSPVFDEHWALVALHRRWRRIGAGDEPAEFRNEGLRIERVVEGLTRKRLV
ncbi:serine protease [Streptomyces sp. DSM 40750]|uniref:serine protease n=1 Tax=Streptomyces sp. DSM 40750 TaxID=2801030 RepID=UPI00214B6436|nr:serine protease [Streptomyces sp. DSM 40750]UUU19290.1 serine protease [Streptomyces sp. DSM 40750]UUU27367.1 serine protease [Streptomyces sp. DSM 40750]